MNFFRTTFLKQTTLLRPHACLQIKPVDFNITVLTNLPYGETIDNAMQLLFDTVKPMSSYCRGIKLLLLWRMVAPFFLYMEVLPVRATIICR